MRDFSLFSGDLEPAVMWQELEALPALLQPFGYADVVCEWCWYCKPPASAQPSLVLLDRLVPLAREYEAAGAFEMGEADLLLRARDGSFEYLFCHDADLHFDCRHGSELFEAMKQRWSLRGFRGSFWPGTKKSQPLPRPPAGAPTP